MSPRDSGVLDLVGVLLGMTGVGSACGITLAVLEQRSPSEIELWGFWGTAAGFLAGIFVVTAMLATRV